MDVWLSYSPKRSWKIEVIGTYFENFPTNWFYIWKFFSGKVYHSLYQVYSQNSFLLFVCNRKGAHLRQCLHIPEFLFYHPVHRRSSTLLWKYICFVQSQLKKLCDLITAKAYNEDWVMPRKLIGLFSNLEECIREYPQKRFKRQNKWNLKIIIIKNGNLFPIEPREALLK